MLTWADASGAPTHHTKLAPEHLAHDVVAEARALTVLAGLPAVSGTVPTLLGLRHGATWAALTASHLPGRPPRARGRPAARRLPRAAGPADVDAVVTAWVAALARDSPGRTGSIARAGGRGQTNAGAGANKLARAVAALDDVALQSVVRQGLDLGATSTGLLHGDLWPGNVHTLRSTGGHDQDRRPRLGVGPGRAPLGRPPHLAGQPGRARASRSAARALDALGGPARSRRTAGAGRAPRAHACSRPWASRWSRRRSRRWCSPRWWSSPSRAARRAATARHERAWLDAVRDVWASWQRTGRVAVVSPSRGGPMKVLHVLDSFSFGGAEQLVASLGASPAPGLTMAAASLAPPGVGRDAMLPRLEAAGLAPVHLGVRRLADPVGLARLVRHLRRSDADVVHAHLGYAATVVPIAARLAGVPCVATLHHVPQDLARAERFKERLSVRVPARLGRLVLVSHAARHEFARRHGPATPSWRVIRRRCRRGRRPAARPGPAGLRGPPLRRRALQGRRAAPGRARQRGRDHRRRRPRPHQPRMS